MVLGYCPCSGIEPPLGYKNIILYNAKYNAFENLIQNIGKYIKIPYTKLFKINKILTIDVIIDAIQSFIFLIGALTIEFLILSHLSIVEFIKKFRII